MLRISLALLLALLFTLPAAADDVSGDYEIDGSHTTVMFRIKHLDVAYFYGSFRKVEGALTWNAADPSKSSISVEIDASSVYTNNKRRDDHIKSPDFLDAKQFPKLTFKSTAIAAKKDTKDTFTVTGDLMLHGVTKSISFDFVLTGHGKDPWGGYRIGGEARFTIKRSEYGIKTMLKGLSDDIQMTVSIEGKKKKKE